MYAVIKTGGKQYRVAPGESVKVETLTGEVGSAVEFKALAVIDGASVTSGAGTVKGTITGHGRGDKVHIFKMRRRKHYRKSQGHRQNYTEIEILDIAG